MSATSRAIDPPTKSGRRDFELEMKSLTSDNNTKALFTGFASVYDNIDEQGDIVEKGAFKRTIDHLATKGGHIPLLWQHAIEQPIGIGKLRDTDEGLVIDGEINLEVRQGREAYALMKQGAVKGLSIGYDVLQDGWKGRTRLLKEVRLHEVSLVTIPANPEAQVVSVKAFTSYVSSLAKLHIEKKELTPEDLEAIQAAIDSLTELTGGAEGDMDNGLGYESEEQAVTDMLAVLEKCKAAPELSDSDKDVLEGMVRALKSLQSEKPEDEEEEEPPAQATAKITAPVKAAGGLDTKAETPSASEDIHALKQELEGIKSFIDGRKMRVEYEELLTEIKTLPAR